MHNLSARLREERTRLGMTQEQLGRIGGVRVQAQLNYEKGQRTPDASYLSAIAGDGVDVLYVLTGKRNPTLPSSPAYAVTPDERDMIDVYRLSGIVGKSAIESVVRLAKHGLGKID